MRKSRAKLTHEQKQEINRQIIDGVKLDVIERTFNLDRRTVSRAANRIGVNRNKLRIAKRSEIKLHAESLILHGATPREAAEAAGCTLMVARNVQRRMRKIAMGDLNEIKKAIEQRSSATCQGAR